MTSQQEMMARYRTTVDLAGERDPDGGRERTLWRIVDDGLRERDRLECLVAALRTELALYRPDPEAAEPAPKVPGFWLVSVAGHTGLCYARTVSEKYPGGELPDFEMPDRKTLCGRQTGGPGSIPGYGWPPASMVCVKCRAALPAEPAQPSLFEDAS